LIYLNYLTQNLTKHSLTTSKHCFKPKQLVKTPAKHGLSEKNFCALHARHSAQHIITLF